MTIRKILEIDVQDDKFRKFQETWAHYEKLLSASPKEWKKVTDQIGGTRTAWDALVAAQTAALARTKLINAAQEEAARRAATMADRWRGMAHNAKSFATHIASATRSLLQWSALTGVISGVLGAGGLFGIERLAMAAGAGRRSALGLGLTFGEQRAFGVNFGRIVDPGHFLGGVNESLHDVTKRYALYGAGLSEGDLRGRDTGQVAAELLPRLKALADRTPEAQLAQVLQARGLGQFISLQDFERLKHTPASEIARYGQQYAVDRMRLDLTRQQLIAWQNLQVQLSRAGNTIETTFIRGLTPLAPQIARLSKSFTDLVSAFMKSPTVKQWIDDVASALETFAKYIGTPQFKADVDNFTRDVGKLATSIKNALADLGLIGEKKPGHSSPLHTLGNMATGGIVGWLFGGPAGAAVGAAGGWLGTKLGDWATRFDKAHQPPGMNPNAPNGVPPVGPLFGPQLLHPSAYRRLEGSYGLPSGILPAVARTESGGNPWAVSRAGAAGLFQFTPGTWAQYGRGSPFDPGASADAAARYFRDLLSRFGGNVAEALAAYNWGPGNVANDIRAYGSAWRSHLPAETQRYLNTILPRLAGPQGRGGTRVDIYDRTGGSVVVSSAQLAT